ncbi:chemotaxis protein CheC [Beggiatoa leptomitoformis]|uniref:Chemotaxis protein CheC n=1 Tax=Beggiatoa leptomitoformis TaxID=288004 RepID=A0A2N9YGC6_9GAMM|nr:chemotaxis protein CheC [Beggiatoa leptomitoformis]ALG68125.1 chemotaxis protein CheC [Beggiatoa leptomitoformis]AUI69578.1 chemotaxis protein CheC [Beggiatoa leptomitoformis]
MIQLSELEIDVITELLNIGMGQAAASLSAMVDAEVKLSVPNIELVSRQSAAHSINSTPEQQITAIKQRFHGSFWGEAILLFPQEKSIDLTLAIIKQALPLETLRELEQDAMMEVGNIILNSCLGSFANILGHELINELPTFSIGSAVDVLHSSIPVEQDIIMLLKIDFTLQTKDIIGYVAFILDISSIEELKTKVNVYLQQFIS